MISVIVSTRKFYRRCLSRECWVAALMLGLNAGIERWGGTLSTTPKGGMARMGKIEKSRLIRELAIC